MRSRARIGSHPIHPMVIALPLGLWVGSFVFDLLQVVRGNDMYGVVGYFMAVAGCAGGVLAAVPGLIDWISVVPSGSKTKTTGAIHGVLNVVVLALFAIEAYMRRGGDHVAGTMELAISTLGVVLLGVSGWLGGSMIYDDHIAVNEADDRGV